MIGGRERRCVVRVQDSDVMTGLDYRLWIPSAVVQICLRDDVTWRQWCVCGAAGW